MSDADEILAAARARGAARVATTTSVDYAALNRMVRRQRAALARAKNSGDRDRFVKTIRDHVHEWNKPGCMWPDDWSHWQRTLDDALPWHEHVDIRDL